MPHGDITHIEIPVSDNERARSLYNALDAGAGADRRQQLVCRDGGPGRQPDRARRGDDRRGRGQRVRRGQLRTVVLACAAAIGLLVPAGGASAAGVDASSQGAQNAEGEFVASVDFTSLQAVDVRGNKCEFTVNGTLTFTGTLEGAATGTTTAVIFAPCADALAAPPGTYFDIFRFEGDFSGDALGQPADGPLSYAGQTRVGGAIDATILLGGDDARAALRADAQVAVGGTYSGVAKRS